MRDKRRAVAWSMGITMTSSPRFKRAKRLALDVPDTLKGEGTITVSITRMLRYIETF
jgi:hypothetical protein